jgi:hypothetical protein
MREVPCVYCEVRTNPYRVYMKFMFLMVNTEYNKKHMQKCNIYIFQTCKLATFSRDGCDDPARRRI